MTNLLRQQAALLQFKSVLPLLAARTISLSSSRSCPSSTAKAPAEHYDIIIGGGGMVGTALAAAVATNSVLADKRVLLLEGGPPFKSYDGKAQYSNRVSAINNISIELFKTIGVWQNMQNERVKPVKQMQVWDGSSDAQIQFQHDHFANEVAYIIENNLMLHTFLEHLRTNGKNVELRNQARIEQVRLPAETGGHAEVLLQGGDNFTCELLIGADGANSLVRKQMGVDVFTIDYESMGLVATLDVTEAGDNSVAWQRFTPTGPVAMLPLNEKMSSLVWSSSKQHVKKLLQLPPEAFVDALNEAFCKEYPKSELALKAVNALNSIMGHNSAAELRQYPPRVTGVLEKSRASFPLGFLHAASYVSTGAALVGDAAHRIHPMAGQGVNLGYSDVRHMVECLAEGAYAGAKLGDRQYLLKYEQKSLLKNVPILLGVHGLQTLYSTTFSPVVFLRSLGLQLTQNVPQIKNMFMRRAIG